jgi:flagellar P-ring protein precursor FlgI
MRLKMKKAWMLMAVVAMATTLLTSAAQAVQIQDLVRLKGGESNKLIGLGLVVGLGGTGDGGKHEPAMRRLAAIMQNMGDPNVVASELRDTKNVALVSISATLPAEGVREGDTVDVHVASLGKASSLKGGRLFLIPMTGPRPGMGVFALAEGAITIEDEMTPTVGVVKNGAQLTRDIFANYVNPAGQITLVLNRAVAGIPMANNLANMINDLMVPDGSEQIAIAIDGHNVVVQLPRWEQEAPARFLSQILLTDIDPSLIPTGSKVVINARTKTIIVSGDVEISPVIIMHEGLTITTITPPQVGTPERPLVAEQNSVAIDPQQRGGARLADLLQAFNQLKVPADDRIAILRELNRSGKLHAQLIEE